MNRIQLIEAALRDCELLMLKNPAGGPFDYVAIQLRYLLDLLKGDQKDRSRLKDINVGLIAIREFDTRFPEFADKLMEIEKVVDDMRFGR